MNKNGDKEKEEWKHTGKEITSKNIDRRKYLKKRN